MNSNTENIIGFDQSEIDDLTTVLEKVDSFTKGQSEIISDLLGTDMVASNGNLDTRTIEEKRDDAWHNLGAELSMDLSELSGKSDINKDITELHIKKQTEDIDLESIDLGDLVTEEQIEVGGVDLVFDKSSINDAELSNNKVNNQENIDLINISSSNDEKIKELFSKLEGLLKSFNSNNNSFTEEILYIFLELKELIIVDVGSNAEKIKLYTELLGYLLHSDMLLSEAMVFDLQSRMFEDYKTIDIYGFDSKYFYVTGENGRNKNIVIFDIPVERLLYLNKKLEDGPRISSKVLSDVKELNKRIITLMMFFERINELDKHRLIDTDDEIFDIEELTKDMSLSNRIVKETVDLLNKTIEDGIKTSKSSIRSLDQKYGLEIIRNGGKVQVIDKKGNLINFSNKGKIYDTFDEVLTIDTETIALNYQNVVILRYIDESKGKNKIAFPKTGETIDTELYKSALEELKAGKNGTLKN